MPFLESNATKYLHRDKSQWMDYVWEFCTKSDLTIKFSQVWNQKKQFPRDAALMEILYETEGIPTSLAKSINRCRLWLKVKYVNKIFDDNTNIIYPWARSGDLISNQRARFSTLSKKWPDQSKCTRVDWNTWYEFIKRNILVNGERSHQFRPNPE